MFKGVKPARRLPLRRRRHPTPAHLPLPRKIRWNVGKGDVLKGKSWVVDGDTIKIRGIPLRLWGIDAPEIEHPYGVKSKNAMIRLCHGQIITARICDTDAHGRPVARCYLPDGTDLSAELVRIGLAIDWPKFSGGVYRDLEVPGIRKKLWRCVARQQGRMPPQGRD